MRGERFLYTDNARLIPWNSYSNLTLGVKAIDANDLDVAVPARNPSTTRATKALMLFVPDIG